MRRATSKTREGRDRASAKAQPGKLNYGAGTITTQADAATCSTRRPGSRPCWCKYNGSAQVAQGLLTKSVDFTHRRHLGLDAAGPGRPVPRARQVRQPAVPAGARHPDLITAELPNFDEITVWLGLVAPKGTPPPIVDKLQRAGRARFSPIPAIKAKADASGLFPATNTPAEFAAFIRKEAERWSTVVQETGIQYD